MVLPIDRSPDRTHRRTQGPGLPSCVTASRLSRLTPGRGAVLADADTPLCGHLRVSSSAGQPRRKPSAGTLER
jgi:hypothetical protein